nr:AarF/UbiB family protein [Bacillota bacterium]
MSHPWGPLRQLRYIKRYRQILKVLIKYGFLPVLERLKLFRLRGKLFFRRPAEKDLAVMNKEKRLRLALEELGPTFIKIGQLLSNRVDLLPASYIQELSLLQDQVKPFPAAKAKEAVERELKLPLPELFQEFAEEPLAAASIAQVHRARLFNGEDVVLKIKRPEIEQQMLMDLEILSVIA